MTEKDQAKFAQAVKSLLDAQAHPAHADHHRALAQEAFMKYKALLNAGFDATQALYLCTQSY